MQSWVTVSNRCTSPIDERCQIHAQKGGHLTEFFNTLPERNNFIRRNRIIAGVSHATPIVESGIKEVIYHSRIRLFIIGDVMAVPYAGD